MAFTRHLVRERVSARKTLAIRDLDVLAAPLAGGSMQDQTTNTVARLVVSVCFALLGCDDDEVTGAADAASPIVACPECVGCDGWRHASCEYAQRCGMAGPRCPEQYAAVQCRSEEQANSCAQDLRTARCGMARSECSPVQVADTDAAVQGCQQYREAACRSAKTCKYAQSVEACLAKPAIDCAQAVALSPSFGQCLSELASLACDPWLPPDSCRGTVITTSK